jgi:hypothetical protein
VRRLNMELPMPRGPPCQRSRSRHFTKDKQRFVVSVVAYDSSLGTISEQIANARGGSTGAKVDRDIVV